MTSIKIVYRPSTRTGNHQGTLYFRIIHNRKVSNLNTGLHIYPSEWDPVSQSPVIDGQDTARQTYLEDIAKNLSIIRASISKIIEKHETCGKYSVENILEDYHLRHGQDRLGYYVDNLQKTLKKAGRERTALAYATVCRALIKFNSGKDILLHDINTSLIKAFENDMKEKGKSLNTISFYMRNLRAIYNKAVALREIHPQFPNPFSDVYTGIQKTRKRALSIEEVRKLDSIDLAKTLKNDSAENIKTMEKAKKLFFFCFHSRGMCFVDMAYLQKNNISDGIIRYYRKKTGRLIEVKVTDTMQEIISSFASEVAGSPYVFPILNKTDCSLRLQYESALRLQNMRLKKLAKLCRINKELSTHVARHTWASIAKHENLPLWVISEGLGHSNEKVTYTYLASLERSMLDKASEMVSLAVRNYSSGPQDL